MTVRKFLEKHQMYYEQMPMAQLRQAYRQDMEAALRGEKSSVMMLPSFLRSDAEPARGEQVLMIDAGGTNLRAGLGHFEPDGSVQVDALKKRRMPGTDEPVEAEEMFRQIAAFALEYAGEARRACISFSYAFDSLPDGDGRIVRLCKELQVRHAEGAPICASLETELQRMGAPGSRSWRAINDSVGSLLGGMAGAARGSYDDYIGFILGTGTNACCCLPSAWVTKSPAAMAMGGETIVNTESGCFDRLLRGTADRILDAASELPGDHIAEKMVSGSYYKQLLRETLLLACREGILSPEARDRISTLHFTSALVDQFCKDPHGDNPIARALPAAREQDFANELNLALLERAARVAAGCLCAILDMRALQPGSRVCVCADGTMLRKNPVLLPRMEAVMAAEHPEISTSFRFVEDATILGCAWAALI